MLDSFILRLSELTTFNDLFEAIRLAEEALATEKVNIDEYSLVKAERMLGGCEYCSSTRCWKLIFKLTRLIPSRTLERIGAGGEIYFTVDLNKSEAILVGYGE